MADNQDVVDVATEQFVQATSESTQATMASYSAEDLQKVREQEKAKLYPKMEKMAEELAALKKEREEEAARRAAKSAERESLKAEKEKQKEQKELSFKELLAKKEQEFQTQLEAERLEREKAFALLHKEQELTHISNYRQARLEQERDNIVPQLIDMINGNSEEEIEQSIASLKEKSAGIMQDVQQTMLAAKQQMVGARVTAPASGPLDNDSDSYTATPDSIRDMSLADYAKNRAKLLGSAAQNRGQGLFG